MKYLKIYTCDSCVDDRCFILVATKGRHALCPDDITPPCPFAEYKIKESNLDELKGHIEREYERK